MTKRKSSKKRRRRRIQGGSSWQQHRNHPGFLDAVQPAYAVISRGKDNKYGHPHKEVLDRLQAAGIQVFRTDEQGTIIAHSSGNGITWSTSPSVSWAAGD